MYKLAYAELARAYVGCSETSRKDSFSELRIFGFKLHGLDGKSELGLE